MISQTLYHLNSSICCGPSPENRTQDSSRKSAERAPEIRTLESATRCFSYSNSMVPSWLVLHAESRIIIPRNIYTYYVTVQSQANLLKKCWKCFAFTCIFLSKFIWRILTPIKFRMQWGILEVGSEQNYSPHTMWWIVTSIFNKLSKMAIY